MSDDFKFTLAGEIFTSPEGHRYALKSDKGGYDFYGPEDFDPCDGAPKVPVGDGFTHWMHSMEWPPEREVRIAERRQYLASISRVRA